MAYGEPIPGVTGVSPKIGPTAGGTTVSIAGVNFTEVSAVKFGSTPAASYTVNSPTSITAVSPPGANVVDVSVTTPVGESATGPADRFQYQKPPVISKISAKTGPATGGTTVVITGEEFAAATEVRFGTVPAEFHVSPGGVITTVSPAHLAGIVDITVVNTAGASAPVSTDRFKFTPSVTGLAPSSGPAAGGTTVTITGTGFSTVAGATSVKFGAKVAKPVVCSSSTTCEATAPAGIAGAVNVVVTVGKAASPVSKPADEYTYE
jgi:hypothetical protein